MNVGTIISVTTSVGEIW